MNCDICGKGFSTPRSLRKHCYSHVEEESQFKCQSCDKMFRFESQLKSHWHMHRHSRNYICAAVNCSKSFKHPEDLSDHAKSHGKPHKCAHCDYENTDIRNLRSHLHTHSRVAYPSLFIVFCLEDRTKCLEAELAKTRFKEFLDITTVDCGGLLDL